MNFSTAAAYRLEMFHRRILFVVVVLSAASLGTLPATGESVERIASWSTPGLEEVRRRWEPWLQQQPLEPEQRMAIEAIWSESPPDGREAPLFDRVTRTLAIADPEAQTWIDACREARIPQMLEHSVTLATDTSRPAMVRNHLHLLFAKTFVWMQLYEEAASHLQQLDVADVADPSSLLFYRGVVEYRLRQKEAGLSTLSRLLENEAILPRRFVNVARLMQADLQGLEEDSLDEVARLMDSIRVRLHHGRAGKRVRDEESEVVKKLDKMIEELEKQRQQMQSQGLANGQQSTNPAPDSSLAAGRGQGDVDRKDQGKDTDWGNLPPADREAALQQVGEDYPSHYREVIEEYFRSLAKEE
jgi:hypothetical protein